MSMADNVSTTAGGLRSSMVEADRYPRVPDVNNHRPPKAESPIIQPEVNSDVVKNQDQELRHYNEKLRQSKELLRQNNELRRKAELQEQRSVPTANADDGKRTFETYHDGRSDKVVEMVQIKPNENLIDFDKVGVTKLQHQVR